MKFTLSRLKDFLDIQSTTLSQLCDALNNLGLEVENVNDPSQKLGEFTVGEIISTEQHPNADRLRVCQVQTKQEILQIVCGAPNARAGIKVCVSVPGMYIPGLNITIKKGKIRDIESCGMLCSYDELGIDSTDKDGIIELPQDAIIGDKVIDVLGINDAVIEISVTPNRPDALGVYGIAKDLSAFGIGTLKPLNIPTFKSIFKSPINITIKHPESCPHFVGYYIKNVRVNQSPEYITKFLKALGCKSINAPVDITNYISYSFARPLHVFDADKIGNQLCARLAQPKETIHTLDELKHHLSENDIVIADQNKPLAIAGIMGGIESGVYDNTVNIFLESAYFNPDYISATGRRLGILSDARYRFERGIDPSFAEDGAKIAAQMIVDLCGGEISEMVVAGHAVLPDTAYKLSLDYTKKLTGLDIPAETQEKILKSLGFTIINQGSKLICVPPANRPDIKGEADCVEEIVRIYGINNVKPIELPVFNHNSSPLNDSQKRVFHLRKIASQKGLLEAVTYSFMPKEKAHFFNNNNLLLDLENPISVDLSTMRPCILAGLLEALSKNTARGFKNVALFEIGRVFHGYDETKQPIHLGILKSGYSTPKNWITPQTEYSVYDIKADILSLLETIGVPISGLSIVNDAGDYYHPKRSASLYLGKTRYAVFGELHPKILKTYDIGARAVVGEIFIDDIPLAKVKKTTTLPKAVLHELQSVTRDFAFVMDKDTTADNILKAVRKAEKKLLTNIEIFDVYQGDNLPSDKKSIALRITLQPEEKSLTDSELSAIMQNIIQEVAKIGAVIR